MRAAGDDDGEPAAKKAKNPGKGKKKDGDDSDDDGGKKKRGFVDRYVAPPPPRQFPVYRPKTAESIMTQAFSLPGIKKRGVLLDTKLSLRTLGTRQPGEVIPAPLFDPLADHAIVLWDPTTDDREAERELERQRKEKEEQDRADTKVDSALERERKKVHKSLAEILGLADRKKLAGMVKKVAVVIDPRVGGKLRPHQVEGVKFLYRCATGMTDEQAFGCAEPARHCLNVRQSLISLLQVHHGRRDGSRQDGALSTLLIMPLASDARSHLATMHHAHVDAPAPVAAPEQGSHRQSHRRVPLIARSQLGQRAR